MTGFEYVLKHRSDAESKEAFMKEVLLKVRSHTGANIQWRDAWDESCQDVTMCFYTFPYGSPLYSLVAIAHGYWSEDGDGVSKGKARIYVDKELLSDWK